MCRSPSVTCSASSISPANMPCSITTFPNFLLSPVLCRRAPICPASGAHWRRLAIFWRCIVVSSRTKKPAASYNAWTSASSPSSLNSIDSPQPKNEERLAGQGDQRNRATLPLTPDFRRYIHAVSPAPPAIHMQGCQNLRSRCGQQAVILADALVECHDEFLKSGAELLRVVKSSRHVAKLFGLRSIR